MKLIKWISLGALVALGCSNELEVLSVQRQSLLFFNLSLSQFTNTTNNARIIDGPLELRLIPQSTEYTLYKRISLTAHGAAGNPYDEFYLTVSFSTRDVNNMVRNYGFNPISPELGGTVSEATLLLRQGNTWRSFNLKPQHSSFVISIVKQSVNERIVKGNFFGSLHDDDDLSVNIIGDFKDISY